MTTTVRLSVDELARRCAQETEKFNRRQLSDPQFCFELLRRALAEGHAEAFTRVYLAYERQVLGWVYSHSRFTQTGESAEYFARIALSTFYFALRGDKFRHFSSLPQVLAYLKLCVHTAIAQYLRDQQPHAVGSLDDTDEPSHTPDLAARADASELWGQICRLLPVARDRQLARCVFLQGLRPREIVRAYPEHWSSEREVTVALYRIRRILQSDPELRGRAGVE
jgi:hypothetical protein